MDNQQKPKLTPEQKLANLNQRLAELIEKKKKLETTIKDNARKERTKHLIEIGAAVEAYAGTITDLVALKQYLEKYGANIAKTQNHNS